jgi:hypothetical protein
MSIAVYRRSMPVILERAYARQDANIWVNKGRATHFPGSTLQTFGIAFRHNIHIKTWK